MEDFAAIDFVYSDTSPIPPSADGSPGLFQFIDLKNVAPVDPSVYPSLPNVGGIVTAPFKAIAGGISSVSNYVSGTVRNTYLYLIGGIVIIGILAVVVLGAGTKFLGKVESF